MGLDPLSLTLIAVSVASAGASIGMSVANQPKAPPKPVDPTGGKQARTVAADDADARRRQQAAASMGRSSTILTSPLGEVGGPSNVQKKTLLGG